MAGAQGEQHMRWHTCITSAQIPMPGLIPTSGIKAFVLRISVEPHPLRAEIPLEA